MKRYILRILMIWGLLIVISAVLGKATIASDNGRAAADFLNIGVGARSAALGGAYSSVADDATAAYWNPGGLTSINNAQVSFSHFAWYQDISVDYLGFAYPVRERLVLAANAEYLNYGTIEGYDADDNPTGELSSTYDLAMGLAVGYRLSENFSVGLGAKYVVVSLADTRVTALAGDFGLRYSLNSVVFALGASNIGQSLKFNRCDNNLPENIRAGIAVRPFGSSFLTSLEIENQFYGNLSVKNGFELKYHDRYFLRTGYSYFPNQDGRSFGQSLSFGVGAILGPAQFDYSFSPEEQASSESIHRFSVNFNLGK
jgi:hypothetical protein